MQTTQAHPTRKSLFIVAIILILVTVLHTQNLFQYPYYQDAEGTSIANSWALVTQGRLSPYTYAYEEPPVGTFILSSWLSLTGGTMTFGFPINSGRILMLILSLISTAFIYGIAYKSLHSDLAGAIATLLFALSPLATMLQRAVLLDNMMLVFLLAALYLILGERRTLAHYVTSAVLVGLAVLTKGEAIFFVPAFLFIVRLQANVHHKRFASVLWIVLFLLLVAFYPLYAQMKQELIPQGWLFGSNLPHVSLLGRLADRGPDTGRFLNIASGVATSFRQWVDLSYSSADPILIYGGLIAALFVLLLSLDKRELRPIVAMLVSAALFLLFGGQIVVSAAIVLLPFLAICVGIVLATIANWIGSASKEPLFRFGLAGIAILILLYPFGIFYSSRVDAYTLNQVNGQLTAVDWLKANVSKKAVVVTDNYAFDDLRTNLPNTQYYWKVDTDPAVKYNMLDDDPCNIDYVLYTPQVSSDIQTYHLDLMRRTLDASKVLITYSNNGWPVEIRQVSKLNCKTTAVDKSPATAPISDTAIAIASAGQSTK